MAKENELAGATGLKNPDNLPADFKFPGLPWTHEKLGEEKYSELAVTLGYYNPATEPVGFRPDLDPTKWLAYIKRDNKIVAV